MNEKIITEIEEFGIKAKIITPDDDGHYFFGYYDLQPFSKDGRYHLCHKVHFEDRIPTADDVCEIGAIDLQTNKFIKYAETTAWNFQQGAMLQWYRDDEHILFNVFENGSYGTCILNINTGDRKILPLPVAAVSQDGKWGLSINFLRIFDFRAGYGYSALKDPYFDIDAPDDDGVFLLDMESGEYKMLISYAEMKARFPHPPRSECKLLINHITFNPSGDRYCMLLRNFPKKDIRWATMLLTGDLNGGVYKLSDYTFQSHYNWKNDRDLLIYGSFDFDNRKDGLYIYHDLTQEHEFLPDPNPERDLHCIYSPNRRYILGDDYPVRTDYCRLHLIDTEKSTDRIIGSYYSTTRNKETEEFRCDRHARFDRSGRYITFDSNHTGIRTICLLDLADLDDYEY